MNAHDVARALTHLARVLKAGPNVPIEDVGNLGVHAGSTRKPRSKRDVADKGAALAVLSQLSQTNKRDLAELIFHLGLPVEVKNTDSVRDLLGRTLKYIAENPEVGRRLAFSGDQGVSPSPALANALAILLGQR